jgi:hypothetical protein
MSIGLSRTANGKFHDGKSLMFWVKRIGQKKLQPDSMMVPRDGIYRAAQAADTGIFRLAGKFEMLFISAT